MGKIIKPSSVYKSVAFKLPRIEGVNGKTGTGIFSNNRKMLRTWWNSMLQDLSSIIGFDLVVRSWIRTHNDPLGYHENGLSIDVSCSDKFRTPDFKKNKVKSPVLFFQPILNYQLHKLVGMRIDWTDCPVQPEVGFKLVLVIGLEENHFHIMIVELPITDEFADIIIQPWTPNDRWSHITKEVFSVISQQGFVSSILR